MHRALALTITLLFAAWPCVGHTQEPIYPTEPIGAISAPALDDANEASEATLQNPEQPAPPVVTAPEFPANIVAAITGPVSYYGREFAGRKTANGERFDPNALTMAHKSLPFGTLVRVTNLFNNKSIVVRVNDRGPYFGERIGDLSAAAAALIDMVRAGVVRAQIEIFGAGAKP